MPSRPEVYPVYSVIFINDYLNFVPQQIAELENLIASYNEYEKKKTVGWILLKKSKSTMMES